MSAGPLIVIEGIDGTGKTTLARALGAALRGRGREVVESFEPTRGPHGQRIRAIARGEEARPEAVAEAELFRLDRRAHVADVIAPALATGKTVILDRYYYSTMAYQGARGLDPQAIERDNASFAPLPDLLVILDLPVPDALERITQGRGGAPDAFEKAEALEKIRAVFASVEHPNLLRLDARQTTDSMVAAILERLGEG
jgi:dTMP kinase